MQEFNPDEALDPVMRRAIVDHAAAAVDAASMRDAEGAAEAFVRILQLGPAALYASTALWVIELHKEQFGIAVPDPRVQFEIEVEDGTIEDATPSIRLAARFAAAIGNGDTGMASTLYFTEPAGVHVEASRYILSTLGRTIYANRQAATS